MPHRGKKYIDATRRFERAQVHSPAEALGLVKSLSSRNFTTLGSVEYVVWIPPSERSTSPFGVSAVNTATRCGY